MLREGDELRRPRAVFLLIWRKVSASDWIGAITIAKVDNMKRVDFGLIIAYHSSEFMKKKLVFTTVLSIQPHCTLTHIHLDRLEIPNSSLACP